MLKEGGRQQRQQPQQQQLMTGNGSANERAAAAAVAPADIPRALMETVEASDHGRHPSDRGTVMMVELLSVGMTVMRVIDLAVGVGVDLPHVAKIGTGIVFAMTGTGMIGIGIGYEIDNHLKENEIIVIGTAAEKGTAKENGIEMSIVADVPPRVLETGTRTELVTVTVKDREREAGTGIETVIECVSANVNENENEKGHERRNKIANVTVTEKDPERGIETARETETGGEHPPNHAAVHLRGNGHDPE